MLSICPVQMVKIKRQRRKLHRSISYARYWFKHKLHLEEFCKETWDPRLQKTHLTMNLAGGQKKAEESELIDLAVSSTLEQCVQKSLQAYAINKPCSSARTVSRTALESYAHLKPITNNLHHQASQWTC